MALQYAVWNGHMPSSAPYMLSPVACSTTDVTMLQLVPSVQITPIEWGISFNGDTAATPIVCDLVDSGTVAATVTAFNTADVYPWSDPGSTPANTSGSSGLPLELGTALSGFTSSAEGTITSLRFADAQQIAPSNQYLKQFPLGREFKVPAGHVLRVRVNSSSTNSVLCYVIFEM